MKKQFSRTGMLTALVTAALTGAALAMPSGGTLTQGNVTVDQGSLAAMSSGATIKATEDSVIEWTDFDLAAADELHFDGELSSQVQHLIEKDFIRSSPS